MWYSPGSAAAGVAGVAAEAAATGSYPRLAQQVDVPALRARYAQRVAALGIELQRLSADYSAYWQRVAGEFANPRYFGTGSLGQTPRLVLEALADFNAGPDGYHQFGEYRHWHEATVARVAGFLGVADQEVGLVEDSTVAMNLLAAGMRLPAGSRVITADFEHPSGRLPWLREDPYTGEPVYDTRIAALPVTGASAASVADAFLAAVTADAQVVQFSHVDRYRGLRLPAAAMVAEIRRRAPDAFVVVDAAQSIGAFPVDVAELGCDALITSLHKWALAPSGSGVLYVRREALSRVASLFRHGPEWSAVAAPGSGVHERLCETSTCNWGVRFATEVALELIDVIGGQRIFDRGTALADRLRAGVVDLPGITVHSPADADERTAIFTCSLADGEQGRAMHERVQELARQRDLLVFADALPGGASSLRLACHVYNDEHSVDQVIAVLSEVAGGYDR